MANASPAVLSVRVSPAERALLEAAAEQARTNLSDFIRRKALESWVHAPAKEVPALRKLAATRPAWRD